VTLTALVIGTCLVQGTVLDTSGGPVAGAAVLQAATGDTLALTNASGEYLVEAPERSPGESVLEFRHPEHFPLVERVRCEEGERLIRLVPRVYRLEPMQFSATRLARPWETTPAREDVLEPEDFLDAEGGGPTLAQAVQQLPGVGAVGRDGLTAAPTIRGLGRDRSLILVEGMRISSDRGVGPTASFLDPFLLRQLSVVRGASGVAYGSGALGGVISTGFGPMPEDPSVSARIAGSTNGDGLLVAARIGGTVRPGWRAGGGGYFRTQSDYDFASGDGLDGGTAPNSGFDAAGGILVLENDLADGVLRLAGLGSVGDEIGRPTTRSGRIDTIEDEEHALATARWAADDGRRRTELGLGWHRPVTVNRTERFDDAGSRTRTGRTTNDSDDLTLTGLAERPLGDGTDSWLGGVDVFSRVGVDATESNDFFSGGIPTGRESVTLVSNAYRADVGAFAGWKRPVREIGEVIVAGRLDWAGRGADGQRDADWLAPSFTAGGVLPVARDWALTGQVARAFRAPRIQELYFEGDRPAGSRLANPDLEPETAWSAELGTRFANGPWSGTFATWGMLAKDLIVQLPVDAAGDTLKNFNESEGRLAGVEVSARWSHPDDLARVTADYAFVYGENGEGDPLPDIPSGEIRFAGNLRVWKFASAGDARVRAELRAGAAKRPVPDGIDERWYSPPLGPTDVAGDEAGTPGYARLDVGLRLKPWSRAAVDVAVTNVLDSRYLDRPEPDAYPQPGRSLRLELVWD
jgi:iron complex outermembrane receptor protein